jgi:ABC-type multidrug transport system fused ATPase/permease subunit
LVLATSPGLIGYVPQDVYLVRGTVRENIGLGLSSENIDDVAVWEALRLAELEEIISAAPRGLDTEVGERGVRLSGGQRQRLGLARALYSKPNLLVLDEATSALDSETEAAVTRALQHLSRDVTRIVIAHRLATVRDCDQVAYLEEGKILAVSTFQEVRDLIPRFDSQAGLLGL